MQYLDYPTLTTTYKSPTKGQKIRNNIPYDNACLTREKHYGDPHQRRLALATRNICPSSQTEGRAGEGRDRGRGMEWGRGSGKRI